MALREVNTDYECNENSFEDWADELLIEARRKKFRGEFYEYIGWHTDDEWFLDEQ